MHEQEWSLLTERFRGLRDIGAGPSWAGPDKGRKLPLHSVRSPLPPGVGALQVDPSSTDRISARISRSPSMLLGIRRE
jgi:hypothetical protein